MTTGPHALEAAPGAAPGSSPPAARAPGRRPATGLLPVPVPLAVALVALAPLLVLGVAGLPPVGDLPAPAVATRLLVLGCCVLVLRLAPRSAHPRAWRLQAAAFLVLLLGGALARELLGPDVPGTLGSIPGWLLLGVSVAALLPTGSWQGVRQQLLTSIGLFVVACLLSVHAVYVLVLGGEIPLDVLTGIGLHALAPSISLLSGVALLLVACTTGPARRTALLVLVTQLTASLSGSVAAFGAQLVGAEAAATNRTLGGAGLALSVACATLACWVDRTPPAPRSDTALLDPVSALLPHLTALLGGSLLIGSILVTGRVSAVGLSLGVAGLGLLFCHQAVTWRVHRRLSAELQRSEAWFRALVRSSADPVVIVDDRLQVTWASPALTTALSWAPARVLGRSVLDGAHPDDVAGLRAALLDPCTAGGEGKTVTARLRHARGSWQLVQALVRDLRSDPDVGALVLYCRDVTAAGSPAAARDTADAPAGDADPVTGLPGRTALVQRLAGALRDGDRPAALVVLSVTGPVDAPGLPPLVLQRLTRRFVRVLRTEDWIALAGPARFAVLVAGSVTDAESVAARLTATVDPDHPVAGLRLSVAAGVTPLHGDVDAGEALARADLAVRSAAAAGPGRVHRHSDALRIAQDRGDVLRADLDAALGSAQFRLVYQPIVDLALHRTGSVEALLRWEHPVYGPVSPAEFIPLAEESGTVVALGRWVLQQATAAVAALDDGTLAVAVNVSARHLRSGELLPDVVAALQASGLPPTRLTVEITESVLLEDAHAVDDLAALRRLGVRVAVDDFGTGWSSLAYLVGLPIDVLKMDRQFLARIEHDPQRRALCRSVLHLGTSLGMDVVVEGVETAAELQLLRDMGHRFVQGFLLARPLELPALPGPLPSGVLPSASTAAVPA